MLGTMTAADAVTTRIALQRVATHVLARWRHQRIGRFGLRPTTDGFATPAVDGDTAEALRVAPGALLHEASGRTRVHRIGAGTTLAELAEFVAVDLGVAFSAGEDTPEMGDPEGALGIEPVATATIGAWFGLGGQALRHVLATLADPVAATPSAVQLWPEHFDVSLDLAWGPGDDDRVNLGASPGDGGIAEPYLYVGPWGDHRPGGGSYWNEPFGAVRRRAELGGGAMSGAVGFLVEGLDRLHAAAS